MGKKISIKITTIIILIFFLFFIKIKINNIIINKLSLKDGLSFKDKLSSFSLKF